MWDVRVSSAGLHCYVTAPTWRMSSRVRWGQQSLNYHWLLKMTAHTHLVTTFAAAVRVIVGRTKTKTRKTFRASFSNLSVGRSCQSYSEIWVASLKHAL